MTGRQLELSGPRPPLDVMGGMPPLMPGAGSYRAWTPRRARPERRAKVTVIAEVHRKDLRIRVKGLKRTMPARGGKLDEFGVPVPKGTRGQVKRLSRDSAQRLRFFVRNTADMFDAFVTLTYPSEFPTDGRQVKRHLNAFCSWLRRKKVAYLWVLEFQRRGAPHFHFLVRGHLDRDELSRRWFEIVGTGDLKHLAAGTQVKPVKNPDEAGGYMGAYLSKLEQKTPPEGFVSVGRFWGHSRMIGKVMFGLEAEYQEAARALRAWRASNMGERRAISERQAARAAEMERTAATLDDAEEKRRALVTARTCASRARSYARPWKWRGFGFVALNSARNFKAMLARQAVMLDSDRPSMAWADCECGNCAVGYETRSRRASPLKRARFDAWKDWTDAPKERGEYFPPWMRGQLLTDGTLAPEDAPDADFNPEDF